MAPRFGARLAAHAWWILLLAALALLWVATARRVARVDAITNSPMWSVDAPRRDASSPTGYAQGQRRLIVPGHHNPSFWWIMEAQQSAAEGSLRVRHIDYDSAPDGRDIRRTAPYRWWLIATGWLHGAVFPDSSGLGYAIERGALIADPLLLALLLVVGAVFCARYIGSFAAIGFVVGGISLFPLAAGFQPGAPDPHSLGWVLALGSVLPLLARPEKTGARSRVHFMIAGICGGLGFWNDATSQAPVLLATALGGLLCRGELARGSGGIARKQAPTVGNHDAVQSPLAPSHWRAWAMTGALITLGASAFEFAPGHFTWSLDSVNPIHAVAWWGLGELLHATEIWFRVAGPVPMPGASTWRQRAQGARGHLSLALLGLGGLAIVSWPVVGIMGGSGGLLAQDFYAIELANHPSGVFAPNLGVWLNRPGGGAAKLATLAPFVLLFVLVAQIFLGKVDREDRSRLVFVTVAALLVAVLACQQLRWWSLFDVFALTGLVALFAGTKSGSLQERWPCLGAAVLVLPGLFVGFPAAPKGEGAEDVSPLETQALIARDFAGWLVKRSGPEPNVLFSTPIFSSAVAYYGGFDVVVSGDDANQTGYLTAVRIASAATAQEASILLRSRGITHMALPLWDPTLDRLVRIGSVVPADQPLPPGAFAVALRDWDVPLWMRPMGYTVSSEAGFEGFELRALALQTEVEPDLGLSRLADFFVERGQLREAKSVSEALKAYPRSTAALGAIAKVDLALRDRARLEDSLETLIPSLSRRSARDLPADRRISLATVFIQTNHVDLARDQVTACFEGLDADTLRTLTPGSVVNLLALGRSLAVPFPDKDLEAAAVELIPPGLRAGLMQK